MSSPSNSPLYERDTVKQFLATRVARPSSAGVIIENAAGEALLLKAHYKPYWSFPGGWVEDTQTPLQAALRELQEEVGIELDDSDVEFVFMVDRMSELMHTYQFMFRARIPLSDELLERITLQADEISEWRVVSKGAVLAGADNYGGAVIAWARDEQSGYVEQRIG